jgi:formate hydrogenlyase subunit 6/NADH:ubiquinone oxidoreductase subunit I
METVIEKGDIPKLLRKLSRRFRVIAPQERNGETVLDDLADPSSLLMGYRVTILPPKKYLFPPEETLFTYSQGRTKANRPKERGVVLFGLSLRDLEAITQLDEIMYTPHPDYFYWKRRSRCILVGLTNERVSAPPGGDMILERLDGKRYRALPLTPAGERITRDRLFAKEEVGAGRGYEENQTMKELKDLLLDPELLSDAVSWSWSEGHPLWEELGKRCIGCGICTYVCPICHCFSMENSVSLDGTTCTRCRKWDACTLPGFARIAGGYDHHPSQKKRYHNWYYHKFVRGYREYGKSQCIACGRCQHYCPARIDIEKELSRIVRDYKETLK